MKKTIVGLGNPGLRYENTRHNVGFAVVDMLAKQEFLEWKVDAGFNCLVAENADFLLIKPQSFMNNSGKVLSKYVNYFKLEPQNIYIVHDEVDLPLFDYKVQFGRSSAGHHGVEDIIMQLGLNDFWRVRIGVGRPESNSFEVEDWVLSKLSSLELEKLVLVFEEIIDKVLRIK